MNRTALFFSSFSLASSIALVAPSVFAQTPAELADARTHYQTGEAKFKAGDFENALKEFRAAEAVKATPHAARYIGLSADKLGRSREAASAFERFLTDVPKKLEGEVEGIKKRLGEIKAMPGKIKINARPTDAMVAIDGGTGLPAPREFTVPAGKHMIKVTATGWKSAEQEVVVEYASTQEKSISLDKDDAKTVMVADAKANPAKPVEPVKIITDTPANTPKPAEPRSLVPVYVTGGVAIAALGAGAIFGALALSDSSKFKDTPTSALADSGENKALIADMFFGIGITFGVTCAILYFTKSEDAEAPKDEKKDEKKAAAHRAYVARPHVTPVPFFTNNGGGAGAVVQF